MCEAEFQNENNIEWHWYKCEHYCNNCHICVKDSDMDHKTHVLEEIEIYRTYIRQLSTWGSHMPGPMHVRT